MRQQLLSWVFRGLAFTTVGLLLGIFVFLGWSARGAWENIPLRAWLSADWNPTAYGQPRWGILGLVAGSLWVGLTALTIVLPLGLAVAIYLSEIAGRRVREIGKPLIEMIASIPSVVLGLVGLVWLAPLLQQLTGAPNGLNALTAGLLVSVAALPTVASLAEDALSDVNRSYRQASWALGASRWQTIYRIVLPAARSGLVGAAMLGLGRIIGETIIVLMVAGNARAFPTGMLEPVRPVTAVIAMEIREAVLGGRHWQALFALGFGLFLLTFLLNAAADWILRRREEA